MLNRFHRARVEAHAFGTEAVIGPLNIKPQCRASQVLGATRYRPASRSHLECGPR
jgi:hypothetical protein